MLQAVSDNSTTPRQVSGARRVADRVFARAERARLIERCRELARERRVRWVTLVIRHYGVETFSEMTNEQLREVTTHGAIATLTETIRDMDGRKVPLPRLASMTRRSLEILAEAVTDELDRRRE